MFRQNHKSAPPWGLKCVIFFLTLAFGISCETVQEEPAPTSNVDRSAALGAANKVRWGVQGGTVGSGGGASMAPIYGENSVMVITPIQYSELEAGMIVAYLDDDGRQIVHQLVRKERRGWVAKGINNMDTDPTLVTERNLIGVVYAVFNSDGG